MAVNVSTSSAHPQNGVGDMLEKQNNRDSVLLGDYFCPVLHIHFSPWIVTSCLLSSCPTTLTAMQVYRPVWPTWASLMRRSRPSLRIWTPEPVARGLPSFSQVIAGLGTPSASQCRVTSPPRTVTSPFPLPDELMEGRTKKQQERKGIGYTDNKIHTHIYIC